MTNSGEVLKLALVPFRRALKERGFSAKGRTFYRRSEEGNMLLLSLQRSMKSSPTDTYVTVNYGVSSARIARRLREDPKAALDVTEAHWRKRLADGGEEQWLHVRMTDSSEDTAKLLLAAVSGVLDDLETHASDRALREEWLSGVSPGISALQRLMFLAVLLHEIGPQDRLAEVVQGLRDRASGTVHEKRIQQQLALAGVAA